MKNASQWHQTQVFVVLAVATGSVTLGCASTRPAPGNARATTYDHAEATPQHEGSTMNQEIKNLLHTYQRGLNEADLELVKSVYAEDAVFIGQPFPTATGIDEIAALYSDFLSKLDFNVEFQILELELNEELGFVRTKSVGSIVPKGQKPAGAEGNREVFVLKRVDGAWKIYRYIFNSEV